MSSGFTVAGQEAILAALGAYAFVESGQSEPTGELQSWIDEEGPHTREVTRTVWEEIPGTRQSPVRDGLTWTPDRSATVRWHIRYTLDADSFIVSDPMFITDGDSPIVLKLGRGQT